MEGNSVAIATFYSPTNWLAVESEVIIQQYNGAPLDFLVDDYASCYPFTYQSDDKILFSPYMALGCRGQKTCWLNGLRIYGNQLIESNLHAIASDLHPHP